MSTTRIPTATASSSIADILERVLDMGVVIAGDIRIKLVDIELLTIQIRLVVCSIEKAREIGMDWWNVALDKGGSKDSASQSNLPQSSLPQGSFATGSFAPGSFASGDANELAMRLEAMERRMKDIERVGTKNK
ncbi:MAG: gas vesicle protein [Pirellulaceae bacterium]|nr:gas vesicle protein [Pirellulaceae bacterium]